MKRKFQRKKVKEKEGWNEERGLWAGCGVSTQGPEKGDAGGKNRLSWPLLADDHSHYPRHPPPYPRHPPPYIGHPEHPSAYPAHPPHNLILLLIFAILHYQCHQLHILHTQSSSVKNIIGKSASTYPAPYLHLAVG